MVPPIPWHEGKKIDFENCRPTHRILGTGLRGGMRQPFSASTWLYVLRPACLHCLGRFGMQWHIIFVSTPDAPRPPPGAVRRRAVALNCSIPLAGWPPFIPYNGSEQR
jgi:hypothetical protein